MSLFIISILLHPLILYGNIVLVSSDAVQESPKFELAEIPLAADVTSLKSRVNVSKDQIIYLLSCIENHMKQNKPFLNNNYTIQLLSGSLDIPVYHCSFLLNQVALKSFRDYINGFRVRYFKQPTDHRKINLPLNIKPHLLVSIIEVRFTRRLRKRPG